MKRRAFVLALLGLCFCSSLALHAQQLTVETGAGKPVILNRSDLEALPHVKVAVTDHSVGSATFEGVTLTSVLEKAGVSLGESLKGKRLASYLLVEAADGYRVVIALPELDPAFTGKQILLIFLREGKPLDAKEGPYRIVIPDEKRMARWVRQVTALKILEAP